MTDFRSFKGYSRKSWTNSFLSSYLAVNMISRSREKKRYAELYCRQSKFETHFPKADYTTWNAFIFRAYLESVLHLRSVRYLINNYDNLHDFMRDDLEDVNNKTRFSIITKLQLKTFQDWIRAGIVRTPKDGAEHGINSGFRSMGKTLKKG